MYITELCVWECVCALQNRNVYFFFHFKESRRLMFLTTDVCQTLRIPHLPVSSSPQVQEVWILLLPFHTEEMRSLGVKTGQTSGKGQSQSDSETHVLPTIWLYFFKVHQILVPLHTCKPSCWCNFYSSWGNASRRAEEEQKEFFGSYRKDEISTRIQAFPEGTAQEYNLSINLHLMHVG